ncbi:hypothetical protein K435DRAFT_867965 [Dendrothele bispora CBS 962.96]|uniref:Uncharacterized protein n=1 Tax=Dendrothele bispora (strain CBS 962.96) TaxID=1314807 RepID=A0A4S8LCY7_DENBC|nr:hypothetical protein K435DRAFT_867965 [Dendrothele bispora CBS 962.96]
MTNKVPNEKMTASERERQREARLAIIRSVLEEGVGEASSAQSGAPTTMETLSDLFQATVSLQDAHKNLYDAHAEAEASYENFQLTFSQLSELYKPPSLPASPVRNPNSCGTPRTGNSSGVPPLSVDKVRFPLTQPPTPQTPKKTQLVSPTAQTGAIPFNVNAPSPEYATPTRRIASELEVPEEMEPLGKKLGYRAYVVYNGQNGCHGVYTHWLESQKGLRDGVFYVRGDQGTRLLKGFNSLEDAQRSYTEIKESGILSLFQNPVDRRREKFVVVKGLWPGIYRDWASLLREGLGYRGGLVERHIANDAEADQIFRGFVAQGMVEVLHADV